MWLRAQSTFKGKLYSIQVDPGEIEKIRDMGVENRTSLLDIDDAVDLVIVSVPRAAAYKIFEGCIQKGVAAAHFFTAGFSETDTEEGRRLELLLAKRATEANFCLIGPNCMGILNPSSGSSRARNSVLALMEQWALSLKVAGQPLSLFMSPTFIPTSSESRTPESSSTRIIARFRLPRNLALFS